ncbi:MAG: cation:proton antiporter [Pseudomonadota bacterium]
MDAHTGIVESFFVIFAGAALASVASLYTRQPLLLAYIVVGALTGPFALGLITDPGLIREIAEIGIIFLLFLIGLDLQPRKLFDLLGESLLTALGSTLVFFALGAGVLLAFGFGLRDAGFAGMAMVFSSTIIGIKLLPTTVLHHRHVGEIVISLLLIQDLLAILALLLLAVAADPTAEIAPRVGLIAAGLPLLMGGAFLGVRYVLLPLFARFDTFHEFLFTVAIGWCLALAALANAVGLSLELGAFVAGVSLATSPIAQHIAEQLRPLRDFFLVMFFFAVGAGLSLPQLGEVWLPMFVLAIVMLATKPLTFMGLLSAQGETRATGIEVGMRLGQASEFSLLLTFAASAALLSERAALTIQGATVLTFVISSYLVVLRYPSPIAIDPKLRRD